MAMKPDASDWVIKEQILEDPVSGLCFQFEVTPIGEYRVRVTGRLPNGNREFVFGKDGRFSGAGTSAETEKRPTWLRQV